MTRRFITYAMSLIVLAPGGALFAQTPPPAPTTLPSAQTTPQRDENETITATGCLRQERDVQGLSPNIAERAGMEEDFVLTKVKLTSAGTAGASQVAMYRIVGLENDKLHPLLNQQVEVTGRIGAPPLSRDTTPPTAEPERTIPEQKGTEPQRAEDLQVIRASSIKAIASTCTGGTW